MKKLSSQSTLESSQITSFKDDDLIVTHLRSSVSGVEPANFLNENNKISANKKNRWLRQSIEKQVKKMQEMCQTIKQKTANNKTSKTNQIHALVSVYKQTSNSKQKNFQKREGFSLQKSTALENKINEPIKTLVKPIPLLKRGSLKQRKPIHSLREIREIESFILDQNEQLQMSTVQQHGLASIDQQGASLSKSSQFKILKLIEERLFEKTFLVQSSINNTLYTIKSINKITMDQTMINQLIREVKIQSFLNHTNIEKLYHVFSDHIAVYLVMEPCQGKTLAQKLKQIGLMEESAVRELIKQLCSAVQYMHEKGLVHGEIKSKNIFLNENLIKLTNFQRALYYPHKKLVRCQTTLEDQSFNSNQQQYHKKIDILSIGALTYELLYGSSSSSILDLDQIAIRLKSPKIEFPSDIQISQAAKNFIISCFNKNTRQSETIKQLSQHQFLKKIDKMDKYRWTMV